MALDLTRAKPTPPPSRSGTGPSKRGSTPTAPLATARIETREKSLTELLGLFSGGLAMVGQLPDSQAFAIHGPKLAHEGAELAETNEQVAKVADWLAMVGPYAGILAAGIPLILQLALNHGKLPSGFAGQMGTMSPDVLEAQAQANFARIAADQLEEQNAARREAQEQMHRAQQAYAEAQSGQDAA